MLMTPDLLIQHGTLLDPETGETRQADILIQNGIIVRIGEGLHGAPRMGNHAMG